MRSIERHGFHYQIAGPRHDGEIARLLNDNAIPGWVSLSYRTQAGWHRPLVSAFKSGSVIGIDAQGRAGGIATRSVHRAFLGGAEQPVGWLGQLRIDRPLRHRAHLVRAGFEALETFLHDRYETPFYFVSIIDGNGPARRLLEKGLEGFPRFEPILRYRVLAMPARSRGDVPATVSAAAERDRPELVAFLNEQNRRRDLMPKLEAQDLRDEGIAGLAPGDFLLHRTSGRFDGAAAVWDQHPYRSIRVTDYRPPLATLRHLINAAAPFTGALKLPAIGTDLRQAYLSFAAVEGDRPEIWINLVRAAQAQARARGAQILAAGFVEGDPALGVLSRAFRHRAYGSTIYRVTFPGDLPATTLVLKRPKIEIGLL